MTECDLRWTPIGHQKERSGGLDYGEEITRFSRKATFAIDAVSTQWLTQQGLLSLIGEHRRLVSLS